MLLAAATFLVAFVPRASTWSATFRGPLVLLEEVDPYYHLRRIELALTNNFWIPGVDSYVNHPHGATIDWAPGFDLLFALVYHLVSKMTAAPVTPAAVGAVGVAVLGSITAAAAAMLASRWGLGSGIAAGLGVAWSPAAVAYSRVGRLDHHAIEPFWLIALCAGYAWSRRRPSTRRCVAFGGLLALSTFFWPGMAFYAAALALAFALEARLGGASTARAGAVTYAGAAAGASLLAATSPWSGVVVYYGLSLFQPLLFTAVAIGFAATAWGERRGVAAGRAWIAGGGVAAALGTAVLLAGGASFVRGITFLTGSDIVATTLLESRSLVDVGFGYTLRLLSIAVMLPVLWVAALRLSTRRGGPDPVLAAALALGSLAGLLTFFQMRFGPHAATLSALLVGWLIAQARGAKWRAGLVAAVAAVLAWGVSPATLPNSMVHPYLLGAFDALFWLRQSAPATSHFRQPTEPAEYGVAAEWVWGHWVTQIGQKPSIASPLGQTPSNAEGARAVARLLLAESDAEAFAEIERLGVRYLLLSSIPVTAAELAVQAGHDPARYVATDATGKQTFLRPFFDTFHSRLYLGGGAGALQTAPVSRARLVFESRTRIHFMGFRSAVRIFEVVPGALLQGRCTRDDVQVRAELAGLELVYRSDAVPAPDGAFELRMPYASEPTRASIPASIRLQCGETESVVAVSERDVLEGRTIAVGEVGRSAAATPRRLGVASAAGKLARADR